MRLAFNETGNQCWEGPWGTAWHRMHWEVHQTSGRQASRGQFHTHVWRSGKTSALRYTFGMLTIWIDGSHEARLQEINKGVSVARSEKRSPS